MSLPNRIEEGPPENLFAAGLMRHRGTTWHEIEFTY
jgi:hypothetical protein